MRASTFLVVINLFVSSAAFAIPKKAAIEKKSLAKDAGHCEISYVDSKGVRSLQRRCPGQTKDATYFTMDDTTAPLLEGRTFKTPSGEFLATRWATGKSEEIILFDLAAVSAKISDRTISDGPSTVAFDKDRKKIRVETLERQQPSEEMTKAVKHTMFWPEKI